MGMGQVFSSNKKAHSSWAFFGIAEPPGGIEPPTY